VGVPMPINLGFILNILDNFSEQLGNQDYITCMNTLRDANRVIQKHEEWLSGLWNNYYALRDENEFYMLFLEFISTQVFVFPRSFDQDRYNLALADDYLHDLDDSDENYERIDHAVVEHLHNLKRIKRKYESFICREHPELIDAAAIYIMQRSGYDNFDFCGRHFGMNTFDPIVWEE
jgi:hypothetical protein